MKDENHAIYTSDVEIGTVRVCDADGVLRNALVFAFVRLLAAPYLQRTYRSEQDAKQIVNRSVSSSSSHHYHHQQRHQLEESV